MNDNGWIKLHRSLKDKGFYKNIKYLAVWIDILLSANHKPTEFLFNNEVIKLEPGQFIMSQKKVSKKFGISLGTLHRILKHFESENQIGKQATNKFTIITITNWQNWQTVETKIETTLKTVETKLKTSETNKNDKNDKNEIMKEKKKIKKKSFSPPTQSEVCKYFSENGYKEEIGDKAFSFYNIAGWKDSRGNQVNNWKQKMISVWFKEENKINNINQKINNRNLTRSEQNAMECQKFIEGAGNEK